MQSVESWNDANTSLGVTSAKDLLTSLSDGVVAFVLGNVQLLSVGACQDVELSVSFALQVLGAHEVPNARLLVQVGELLSILVGLVVQVEQVVRCTAMVFLTSIKVINFSLKTHVIFLVKFLHVAKSVGFSFKALLSEMREFILFDFELLRSHFLVSHRKVFVKAIGLGHKVSRDGVGVVHLSRVNILVVTACTFTKTAVLNSLLVFHCSL